MEFLSARSVLILVAGHIPVLGGCDLRSLMTPVSHQLLRFHRLKMWFPSTAMMSRAPSCSWAATMAPSIMLVRPSQPSQQGYCGCLSPTALLTCQLLPTDVQKFPLRMKDNDLLVTELYRDPAEDAITALSVHLTPKSSKGLTLGGISKQNRAQEPGLPAPPFPDPG